jgi:hypothetical protein
MTDQEALTRALYLSLIAPTEEEAEKATKLAERVAARLSPIEVETAKLEASTMAGMTAHSRWIGWSTRS